MEDSSLILASRNLTTLPTSWSDQGELSDTSKVRVVDVSYNLLVNVEGIGVFEGVEELVLDNNRLSSLTLPRLPALRTLCLNNNNLSDLVQVLDNLELSAPRLSYLSLLRNPLCPDELCPARSRRDNGIVPDTQADYQAYRYEVLRRISTLKFLDSRAVNEEERAFLEKERTGGGEQRPRKWFTWR